jgi:hypothetical protein
VFEVITVGFIIARFSAAPIEEGERDEGRKERKKENAEVEDKRTKLQSYVVFIHAFFRKYYST